MLKIGLLFLSIMYFSFIHAYMQVSIYPIRSPTKYLFICSFITYSYIHLIAHHTNYQSMCLSTHLPDNHPSIRVSIHLHTFYLFMFIYPFIYQPPMYSSIYLPIHLFIYPFMYPFIHLSLSSIIRNMFGVYPQLLTQNSENACNFLSDGGDRIVLHRGPKSLGICWVIRALFVLMMWLLVSSWIASGWGLVTR